MIFFMAGTSDARELALAIRAQGHELLASVVTESAARGLSVVDIPVRYGRLQLADMVDLLRESQATILVDASHPFAEEAHRTAMAAADQCQIPYIRFERAVQNFDQAQGVITVDTYEQAADVAAERKGSVMLTTGSKTLQIFTARLLGDPEIRLIARMLPREDNMQKCAALGMEQRNIIAMQGPFSKELNMALYRHFQTTLMITKESGGPGAVDEKVDAALAMGILVVVIGRPDVAFGTAYATIPEILTAIAKTLKERSVWTRHPDFNR